MARYYFKLVFVDGDSRQNWVFAKNNQDFWETMVKSRYFETGVKSLELVRVED